MTCSTKTATSSLYLIRLLVILNKENSDLLCETDGLKKVVDINTKPGYQQKLRKAAGQVIKNLTHRFPSVHETAIRSKFTRIVNPIYRSWLTLGKFSLCVKSTKISAFRKKISNLLSNLELRHWKNRKTRMACLRKPKNLSQIRMFKNWKTRKFLSHKP